MATYRTPGLYREDIFLPPSEGLRTAVPAFLGYASSDAQEPVATNTPQPLTLWPQFEWHFGKPLSYSYLAYAVRGFFANGGRLCYVVRLEDGDAVAALENGLAALEALDTIDLVAAPDIMRPGMDGTLAPDDAETLAMQADVLAHCDKMGDRLCLLDSPGLAAPEVVRARRRELDGKNGALYYPWVRVADGPDWPWNKGFLPPCGHVAGVFARSDERAGVQKTPANEVLEGVLDLEINLSDAQQGELNPEGINCLRAFPGRGIRVWGGRTLSRDPNWTYISVRRIFLTAGRWIEHNLGGVVFEPHDYRLMARVSRELNAYFLDLFHRGALKGKTPQEAFYVKCDDETNPPEVREAGELVTEIGLAPATPNEFVVVRIVHGAGGISITGPERSGQ
jgi:phage tail sheath protein FI